MGGNQEVEGLTAEMRSTLAWVTSVRGKVRKIVESRGGVWSAGALVDALEELTMHIEELQDQLADIVGEDQL